MKFKRTTGETVFDSLNIIFLILLMVTMLYPFINQIAVSLSSNKAILMGKVNLWPVELQFRAYKEVIMDVRFITAFFNTVFFTVAEVVMKLFVTTMFAFTVSRKHFKGRNIIMNILIFSMMFGTGGLIPNFILIKQLGLYNTYWALWFPSMLSIWHVIILKNFFQQLPDSLEESAAMDGARPFRIFLQIILPLSLPIIAAISLFTAVAGWNTFFNALIYLSDKKKILLQVHLSNILQVAVVPTSGTEGSDGVNSQSLVHETIKAATLMCTTVPILCVYPFVQKYFVKGMMVGAIKG